MGLFILFLVSVVLVVVLGVGALVHALRHPPRQTLAVALAQGLPADPADLGLGAQSITFTLPDRTTTPGWVVAGQAPAGPTVILVHGYGDGRHGSLMRTGDLLPLACRILVYDQRGQGESTAPTSAGGTWEADDLVHLMGQLPLDVQSIVLVGYSMGAGVVLSAGQRDPRVAGVIVEGAYRRWDEPLRRFFAHRRYPTWPIVALARLWLKRVCGMPIDFDRARDAQGLTCPLLVLHSSDDPLCPLPGAQAIAQAADQGQLVQFDQGGHLGLADADPVRYRDALAHFFHALPKAR